MFITIAKRKESRLELGKVAVHADAPSDYNKYRTCLVILTTSQSWQCGETASHYVPVLVHVEKRLLTTSQSWYT